MPKFIIDNEIKNLDLTTYAGQKFLYDQSLADDEFLNNEVLKNDYKFSTGQLRIANPPTERERYLLIESGEILASESNNKFLI
ncbi:MAG: hypothetical protein H7296_04535 [Bacteroidia bacterium]|nr:hypothetical protein [Bacteroidia bacterium]